MTPLGGMYMDTYPDSLLFSFCFLPPYLPPCSEAIQDTHAPSLSQVKRLRRSLIELLGVHLLQEHSKDAFR